MINLSESLLEAIRLHADEIHPRESCGFIVQKNDVLSYYRCTNEARRHQDFYISSEEYARVEDEYTIIAVVHSHPEQSCEPSLTDRVSCEESELPWVIIGLPNYDVQILYPTGFQMPYLERPFIYGILDCYTMVRDWYKREKSIILPNVDRQDRWWEEGKNLYIDNFKAFGFKELSIGTAPEIGDLFLMQIKSPKPNHAAIYIGDGKILQHCMGQLSQRYMYGGTWLHLTTNHLRYA